MAMVAAKCTMCGSSIKVDDSKEKGICEHCGTEFITEKVINVTNITNVDKSTNIYYGETTDAKVKKDLEKAYKALEAAGCNLVNVNSVNEEYDERGEFDAELCANGYTLAKSVTKKDPTNYGAWKGMILAAYYSYFAGECAWLVDMEKWETANEIFEKIFKDIATAKKVAPNDEEKKLLDTVRDNIKIDYYKRQLPSNKDVKNCVDYLEKPKPIEFFFPKPLPWIGGWIALMGLVLLVNTLFKLNISFIPESVSGSYGLIMAIALVAIGAVMIGIFVYKYLKVKRNENKIKAIEAENEKRYNDKKAEYANDIANAKTAKEWETLAIKYRVTLI